MRRDDNWLGVDYRTPRLSRRFPGRTRIGRRHTYTRMCLALLARTTHNIELHHLLKSPVSWISKWWILEVSCAGEHKLYDVAICDCISCVNSVNEVYAILWNNRLRYHHPHQNDNSVIAVRDISNSLIERWPVNNDAMSTRSGHQTIQRLLGQLFHLRTISRPKHRRVWCVWSRQSQVSDTQNT